MTVKSDKAVVLPLTATARRACLPPLASPCSDSAHSRHPGTSARSFSRNLFRAKARVLLTQMASVVSVPAYMLPGVPVAQPPHLEGDPSLATEILPGPPSLASVQQVTNKRDPKKPGSYVSYLPTSDPGSTYGGLAVGTPLSTAGSEEPRRKRARTDKGCVSSTS